MTRLAIPDRLVFQMETMFGDSGREWLEQLPELLQALELAWQIEIAPPFSNLSYTYVAPAVDRNGVDTVLKIGHPEIKSAREMDTLMVLGGKGMCRLLAEDRSRNAMLLERIDPGLSLLRSDLPEIERIRVTADVMTHLWSDQPPYSQIEANFSPMDEWVDQLREISAERLTPIGPFPAEMVDLALQTAEVLLESVPDYLLLHGDLHHDNILYSDRDGWLAIDPKGIIGEPAFEIYPYLANALPENASPEELNQLISFRIDQFCRMLGLPLTRVGGWGLVRLVLSCWWGFEDNESDWVNWMRLAEHYRPYALTK